MSQISNEEELMGRGGVERVTASSPAPEGKYSAIFPQGTVPFVIGSITVSPGFTETNYDGKTLTSPLYIPFTELTAASGEADAYRTVKSRQSHEKIQ